MEIVYIETTIVSHLVANPSRDLVTAGQQQATRDWWRLRREMFQCVTSDETPAESARGDAGRPACAWPRWPTCRPCPSPSTPGNSAAEFLRTGALPAVARSDAVHPAVASIARTDYLLTWNCRHLANAQILRRLEREAARAGWDLPKVCTPLELTGDSDYENEPGS